MRSACRRVVRHIAAVRGIPVMAILGPSRSAEVAAARQVAMYLCHTLLSLTMTDVGRAFGRDRTTVAHACASVEDSRDNGAVDAAITAFEHALAPALQTARGAKDVRH